MGNGKFYEIGTSLAEMAFMANGLIPGPLLSVPLLFAVLLLFASIIRGF